MISTSSCGWMRVTSLNRRDNLLPPPLHSHHHLVGEELPYSWPKESLRIIAQNKDREKEKERETIAEYSRQHNVGDCAKARVHAPAPFIMSMNSLKSM
mmetsp:Transcript_91165/g.190654  ORF Transcript_91165/g.190654 Transcript_91165/m.190654 type:complete len:98 (-) Transcript_91165:1503-1796(-)